MVQIVFHCSKETFYEIDCRKFDGFYSWSSDDHEFCVEGSINNGEIVVDCNWVCGLHELFAMHGFMNEFEKAVESGDLDRNEWNVEWK